MPKKPSKVAQHLQCQDGEGGEDGGGEVGGRGGESGDEKVTPVEMIMVVI